MADVDKKTEDLIGLYLKFSNKKCLSAKEFIKIRKQALKEQDEDGYISGNITHPLEEMERKSKKAQNYPKVSKVESNSKVEPGSKIQTEAKKDDTNSSMSRENLFLSMIKDILD